MKQTQLISIGSSLGFIDLLKLWFYKTPLRIEITWNYDRKTLTVDRVTAKYTKK